MFLDRMVDERMQIMSGGSHGQRTCRDKEDLSSLKGALHPPGLSDEYLAAVTEHCIQRLEGGIKLPPRPM